MESINTNENELPQEINHGGHANESAFQCGENPGNLNFIPSDELHSKY